jgi:hypothetical protein
MKICCTDRDLRRTLVEAALALAKLDADRLEEMALSCDALIESKEIPKVPASRIVAGNAAREFSVLGRVLDSTSTNLRILRELRHGKAQQLEYSPQPVCFDLMTESEDGNN